MLDLLIPQALERLVKAAWLDGFRTGAMATFVAGCVVVFVVAALRYATCGKKDEDPGKGG